MHFLLRKRRIYITALLLVSLGLAFMGSERYRFLESLERLALDWRMQSIGMEAEPPEIVIVSGGEESLARLGSWPWPRTTHAQLLEKLGPARLVILDILFPEPSTPEADRALAEMVRRRGNVVTAMHIAPDRQKPEGIPLPPYADLAQACLGMGVTNIEEDMDGLIRFHTPVRFVGDEAYPSLPLAGASALTQTSPMLEESEGSSLLDNLLDNGLRLLLGERSIPLSPEGNLWLDLSRPAFPEYEYASVLAGEVPQDTFRDKVVLVGISASGAEDFHITPSGLAKRVLPGAQYNAMALESLLAARVPVRVSPLASMLVILLLGTLGLVSALPRHPLAGIACMTLAAAAFISMNLALFQRSLIWVDLVFPLLALSLCHACSAFVRYVILHRDWRLKTYSLSSLYSLESASREHTSLGDFLEDVWPQFKSGSGADLLVSQAPLEHLSADVRRAVDQDLTETDGTRRVVVLRSEDSGYSQKMALPVPAGDGSGNYKYTVLGWRGRLAEDTTRTLAVTILSAAWFYRTLSRGRERRKLLTETIRAIFRALDFRDPITGGHSDRVATLSLDILKEMDLDSESREDIHLGALIHDIGKIGIPDAVLGKPDKLTGDEFGLILKHPTIGREIMGTVPLPAQARRTMAEHHERYDGSGYPKGLAGDELSLGARIVAVADVFDALRSDRPYRKGLSVEQVCDYIAAGSGTKYDPQVVDIVLRLKAPPGWEPGSPPPDLRGETPKDA